MIDPKDFGLLITLEEILAGGDDNDRERLLMRDAARLAIATEREACAKIAVEHSPHDDETECCGQSIAEEIRSRTNTTDPV